jgi:hypothetical protein
MIWVSFLSLVGCLIYAVHGWIDIRRRRRTHREVRRLRRLAANELALKLDALELPLTATYLRFVVKYLA